MHSVLVTLLNLRPNRNDAILTPVWTKLFGIGIIKYSQACKSVIEKIPEMIQDEMIDSQEAKALEAHMEKLPLVFTNFVSTSFAHLMSDSTQSVIVSTAADVFTQVSRACITDGMIQDALMNVDGRSCLLNFINLVLNALQDVRFKDAWGGLLDISGALFEVYLL